MRGRPSLTASTIPAIAPLRSGFVENIHANGPNVYAREQYVLNGAAPSTTYQVVLMIFPGDPTCSSTPVSIPVATIQTNAAGNGVAYHVFTPADADGLHGMTLGGIWTVSAGASPDYQTGVRDHRFGLTTSGAYDAPIGWGVVAATRSRRWQQRCWHNALRAASSTRTSTGVVATGLRGYGISQRLTDSLNAERSSGAVTFFPFPDIIAGTPNWRSRHPSTGS